MFDQRPVYMSICGAQQIAHFLTNLLRVCEVDAFGDVQVFQCLHCCLLAWLGSGTLPNLVILANILDRVLFDPKKCRYGYHDNGNSGQWDVMRNTVKSWRYIRMCICSKTIYGLP